MRWAMGCILLSCCSVASADIILVDRSEGSGLDFVHETGARGDRWLPETMGAGVVVADFNEDDHLDIVLLDGRPWSAGEEHRSAQLYLGDGALHFARQESALPRGLYSMGGLAADFDADGHMDLIITALEGAYFCAGDGAGGFEEAVQIADGWCTSASALDYDGDSQVDLFIGRYVDWSSAKDLWCTLDGESKSYCTPEVYGASTCVLLRNLGDRMFEAVIELDFPAKTLGSVAIDVDLDGWTDLLIANDTMPDLYLRNNEGHSFDDLGLASGMALSAEGMARAGMGIDATELFGLGNADLAVGHFAAEAAGVYRNGGEMGFLDEAQRRGLDAPTRSELTFGLLLLDLDLDGRRDLVTANGHIEPDIQRYRPGQHWQQKLGVYAQQSDGSFLPASDQPDALWVARGLASGDFDEDGDADLILTQNGGGAVLLENTSQFERVLVVNGLQAGSRVRVETDLRELRGDLRVGNSYLSCSEAVLRFGLESDERIQAITVFDSGGHSRSLDLLDQGERILEAR